MQFVSQVEMAETRITEINGDIQKAADELKTFESKAAKLKHIRDIKVGATQKPKQNKVTKQGMKFKLCYFSNESNFLYQKFCRLEMKRK